MKGKKDTILNFRTAISSRYNLYAWVTGATVVGCILLRILLDQNSFLTSLSNMTCFFAVGFLFRNYVHGQKMLKHLSTQKEDSLDRLEKYLIDLQAQWQNFYLIRIIGGCITGLVMLFLLFFDKENTGTQLVSSLFIDLILVFAITGWINFNDQILLHDIRRSLRDQASDISD